MKACAIVLLALLLVACTTQPSAEPSSSSASAPASVTNSSSASAPASVANPSSASAPASVTNPSSELVMSSSQQSSQVSASEDVSSTNSSIADSTQSDVTTDELLNDMTVRVVDVDGNPVPNIGVYINPPSKPPLIMVQSYSITHNDGIAVLQRVRNTYQVDETTRIGLCDRNQSDTIQQTEVVVIPVDSVTPINLVWKGELPTVFQARQPDRVVFHFKNEQGEPVEGLLVNVGEVEIRDDYDPTSLFNNPEIVMWDLSLTDKDFYTDKNGEVVWTGLSSGTYQARADDGRPSFNNVPTNHPRLQLPLGNSESYEFEYNGGDTVVFEYIWKYPPLPPEQ